VSVIMNIRNGASTLAEAIDSVLAQTMPDFEIIAWDDFSSDDSASVVRRYSDPRIRFFSSPEDTSLGRARHLAMAEARGEWLAFLDQDDLWTADKLESQLALADSDPAVGLVYGRTISFFPDGRERDFDHRHEYRSLPEGRIFETLFIDSCFISMSSALLRRSAVEALGGIPPGIDVSPDYFMFLGVARDYTARAVQRPVCRYRLHDENMSRFCGRKMHEEVLWLIERFGGSLDPKLRSRRLRIHNSLVALQDMMRAATFGRGLSRLLSRGSLSFLLSRPFARALRSLRRRVATPYYLRSATALAG
jgi:glycosyltransferase involved in cell wall biosynthesis